MRPTTKQNRAERRRRRPTPARQHTTSTQHTTCTRQAHDKHTTSTTTQHTTSTRLTHKKTQRVFKHTLLKQVVLRQHFYVGLGICIYTYVYFTPAKLYGSWRLVGLDWGFGDKQICVRKLASVVSHGLSCSPAASR